ncbi:MAG: SdrD B-like domain-containing protein [Patescibacteria group bacterium]|nr:SdrD B-like domain-containing protein [Patescibacteria group bacterium]MDD5715248.1 SdrD B-like domain-containing protein [Patescibacteria group bacterium]
MDMAIFPKRSWKQKVWKAINIVSSAALVFNMTMVGVFLTPKVAEATVVWPSDGQWNIPICNDDIADDENPDSADLYSVGTSQYGAAYYIDANNLYVRERIKGNPGAPGSLDQYAWVFMIQKDAATTDYDFLVSVRGSGSGENVELWQNTSPDGPIDWSPIFNDPADTQLKTWNTSSNVRRVGVGSNYYIDWQIPISELTSRGVVVNNGKFSTNHGLFWATSTNANNYNKDHLNCYDAPDLRILKEVRKNNTGTWFTDGRTAGVTANAGDTLNYRVTVTNVGGPTQGATSVVDELGKNYNDGDGDAAHNVDPATQYSIWTASNNLNSDGNANPFTGSWGNGSADGQANDTLSLSIPLISGGGAQEQFNFDGISRNDLAVGTYLFENVATFTHVVTPDLTLTGSAETDIKVKKTGACQLTITKTVDKANAVPGDTLLYTLTFKNTGTIDCTGGGVRVDDTVPAGVTYTTWHDQSSNVNFGYGYNEFGTINRDGFDETKNLLSWNAGVLNPNEEGWVKWKATVNTIDYCTEKDIKNVGKIYADQIPAGVTSNEVVTHVTAPCYGKLKVLKYVDSGSATPDQWSFTLGAQTKSPAAGQNWVLFDNLVPGDYTVTESSIADYHQVSSTCDNVTVSPNQTATCEFHNTRDTGNLKVNKAVDTDGDGKVDQTNPAGWTWDLNAGNQNYAMGSTQNVVTGSYTVSEDQHTNFHSTGWACTDGTSGTGEQLTVNVPTTGVSCTFTNARDMGTLIVKKHVVNDNGGTADASAFNVHVKQATDVAGSPASGSETGTSYYLPTGTYVVSEDAPIYGYAQTSIVCDGQTTDTVNVAYGETKYCTITNDDIQPKLTVTKVVINDNGGTAVVADFPLFVDTTSVTSGIQNGFNAGSYVVSETNKPGYSASITGDCDANGNVTLAVGDVKSCTITNDDQGAKLVVTKHVVNDNGGTKVAADFTINVTGTNASPASFAGDEAGTDVALDAGSYSADEIELAGYAKTLGADCSGTISVGQTKYCTITNDDIAPKLKLVKTVVNTYGGTKQVSDFPLFINGNPVTSGAWNTLTANVPYTASETNLYGYEASAWGGDCGRDGSITLLPGDQKICTITNSDIQPKLTVTKVVNNDNGGNAVVADFPLFVDTTSVTSGVQNGFNAGSYVISETNKAGYSASITGDCDVNGNVTLAVGDVKSCTITNDDIAPKLKLIKYVTNDDGGTKQVADFPLFINGNGVTSGQWNTLTAGVPYTASETSDQGYTASAWGGDCGRDGTITLQPGDQKTCTITNDDIPGKIWGYKYNDVNGNGQLDAEDQPLDGWQICYSVNDCVTTGDGAWDAGYYEFTDLPAATYTLYETLIPGWIMTYPVASHTVNLANNGNLHLDFFNFQLGKIWGYKFNDMNGNSSWDNGELALGGWTIALGGASSNSAVTAPNGYYEFTGLTAGTYSLSEVQQDGWVQTTANPANVTITSGKVSENNNFGNFKTGKIAGHKWNDLNGNGAWDGGEPALAGWEIKATNGTAVKTTTTDANGEYAFSFQPLEAGVWTISETLQAGWTQTAPAAHTYSVGVHSGTNVSNKDFGNFKDVRIKAFKYNDLNGNGALDAGEPAIEGWKMYLNGGSEQLTNASGYASWYVHTGGTFTVSEENRTGWTHTSPASIDVSVTSGDSAKFVYFYNFENVDVKVNKLIDTDGDIATTGDRTVKQGWTVQLWKGAAQIGTDQITDVNGSYTWTDLGPGTYTVKEIFNSTEYTALTNTEYTFTVSSGTDVERTFINFENIDVTVCKYVDMNGDGDITGDPAYTNSWEVTLGNSTQLTGANGCVTYTNAGPGNYDVTEDTSVAGWVQTYPRGGSYNFDAVSGVNRTFNFGNFETPHLTVIKHVINDNGGTAVASDFTMNVSGTNVSDDSFPGDEAGTTVTLDAGAYSVDEDAFFGYAKTIGADCAGSVVSGDNKTCTITNDDIAPELTVVKHVINDNGGSAVAADFTMNVTATNVSDDSFPGDEIGVTVTLDQGAYSVDENAFYGYAKTLSADCTGTINVGETKTCTITNDDIQPKLTVTKVVINDNGGTAVVADFPLFVDATSVVSGVQNGFDADDYVVSETNLFGYSATISGDCDVNGNVTLNVGDVKSCTITNDDIAPELTVVKHVINDNGGSAVAADFTMNVTGTNVSDDSFAGDEAGVTVTLDQGVYGVDENAYVGYAKTLGADCTGTINVGETKTCTITNDDIPGKISGYKYDDHGTALQGWTICIIQNAAPVNGLVPPPFCTVTDANGYYEFAGLNVGTFTISETLKGGWTQLEPVGVTHVIDVVPGTDSQNNNFVNRLNEFNVDIEKSAPATVVAGDEMTYTLDWTITGNTPVFNAHVSDVLPANTTFVSAANGGTYDSATNTVTWDLGTVNPDDSGTVTFVVKTASPLDNATVIENTGEVCGTGYIVPEDENELFNPDGTTKCDSDKTTTTIESAPILGIEKTNDRPVANPGDVVNYTITWSVDGNSKATNVTLTDTVPVNEEVDITTISNGGTYDAATRIITWDLGTQIPHAEGTVTYSVDLDTPLANGTTIVNVAKLMCDETDPLFVEDDSTVVVKSGPILEIDKTVNKEWVNPGDTATYTVVVKNTGNDTAINTMLTDLLPTGFTFVEYGTDTHTWSLGDLEPGDSVTTVYDVKIGKDVAKGTYDNLAVTWADNYGNVSDKAPLEVRIPQVLGTEPELVIDKVVDKTFINPGGSATYTVTVKNIGEGFAFNVKVQDVLPAGFSFEDGDVTKVWTLGDMAPDMSKMISYKVVAAKTILAGTYENIATAWADNNDKVSDSVKLEVRIPKVLGEELPVTGGSLMFYVYLFAAGLIVVFSLYMLKVTSSNEDEQS